MEDRNQSALSLQLCFVAADSTEFGYIKEYKKLTKTPVSLGITKW